MWRLLTLANNIPRFMISNVSKKKFKYSFETGVAMKPHPRRNVQNGSDKLFVSEHLIVLADHGNSNQNVSVDLDQDRRTQKLVDIISVFFDKQRERYTEDPQGLVEGAIQVCKAQGLCTLTIAILNAQTGELSFYYVGDNIYGIFRKENIVMVQALYERFNKPYKIGQHRGYVQKYQRKEVKDDVIVLGSNGLWDNLNLEHIHYLVRGPYSYKQIEPTKTDSQDNQSLSLKEIAEKLSSLASVYSRKGNYESPIYKMSQKKKVLFAKEGILDDVSVILARIKRDVSIE